jgi:hypothetical protein
MEALVGVLVLVLGGLVWMFKSKADRAAVDAKLAQTKGQDMALAEQQKEVAAAIITLDNGIAKMKEQKAIEDRKREFDNLSLKERADRIKKGLS